MRRLLVVTTLIISLLFFGTSAARVNVLGDFSITAGLTDNLLTDSSDVKDSFSSYSGTIRAYALPYLELNANTNYTYYGDFYNLSNLNTGVGFIMIPTKEESPFSLYLASDFSGLRYREEFSAFDNNTFVSSISAGYRWTPGFATRVGLSWRSTAYISSDSGDKESWELFTGFNYTPFGSNSVDFEIGFGSARYSYIPVKSWGPPYELVFDVSSPEDLLSGGSLKSLYVAPRFSRPLGFKTGMSVSYTYRTFMKTEDGLVFGSSVGLLSPWTSVWEGGSITANVKSYIIPTVTFSAGFGYWEKTFLSTLDDYFPVEGFAIIIPIGHVDNQRKMYMQLQRPIGTPVGVLQPVLRMDYVNNGSTNALYEYSGFSYSLGISYQL